MVGKIRLIVAIEDEIYLDRICDYLETSHGRFTTERFSDRAAFSAALVSRKGYDAVLYEPTMVDGQTMKAIDIIKIRFGDKEVLIPEDGCYVIREYMRTDAIANAILNICSMDKRFMGIEVEAADRSRIYVFTSPVGGAGVTTLSLAAALQHAKAGRKTLYITLEQTPSIRSLLAPGSLTMTQVMRMAIENNPKLLTAVEGGRSTEPLTGLEYFDGFGDLTDFDALRPEHIRSLTSRMSTLGRYDTIIVDTPWNTSLGPPLWENSDKIFLVSRNTTLSVCRVNAFLQYAAEKELTCRNRLHVVLNALNGGRNSNLSLPPAAEIPSYPMLIDTADFSSAVLGSGIFSDSLSELVRQF